MILFDASTCVTYVCFVESLFFCIFFTVKLLFEEIYICYAVRLKRHKVSVPPRVWLKY